MAQRRMFSKRITNSGRFLKMPTSSQALYFHLGMEADDDGVVEAFKVLRSTGFGEDDLKVLVAKSLVKVLNEDLVSFILDWREHNLIRSDRKIDSIYKNLLLQMIPDADIINPTPRADTGVIPRQITGGRPVDAIGKDRIGKVSKDKKEIQNTVTVASDGADVNEVINLFKEVNPAYSKFFARKPQREAVRRLLVQWPRPKLDNIIKVLPQTNANKYAPTIISPLELEDKMGKLIAFIQKERTNGKGKTIIGL